MALAYRTAALLLFLFSLLARLEGMWTEVLSFLHRLHHRLGSPGVCKLLKSWFPSPPPTTLTALTLLADLAGEAGTLPEKRGPTEILLGRKAGTDRGTATLVAAEGIPEGFCPGESGRVALETGERERQRRVLYVPWHFLYFFPLPQGQGSLRPTLSSLC